MGNRGADTYSMGITFTISCFGVFVTQFVHGCSMTWSLNHLIETLNSTHGFHDSNMFLSDQCGLLLIGQILVTIDSLDLVLKLLLASCYVMMCLHK